MTWQTTFRSAHTQGYVMHWLGVGKDATCTPTPKGDCHQKLMAMDTPPLSIWCHQPSGMKIASPACSVQSRALHKRDAMPFGEAHGLVHAQDVQIVFRWCSWRFVELHVTCLQLGAGLLRQSLRI